MIQAPLQLLTVAQMTQADDAAVAAGVPSLALMEAAGQAVVREIRRCFRPCRVTVLAGPGNNGGDGFVVARLLEQRGWPVRVALWGQRQDLRGDAAAMAARWRRPCLPLTPLALERTELVVDALFGAGLSRPLSGDAATVLETVTARALPCVAIDMPSGVEGDSGQVLGVAAPAHLTVTFFRKKPGHVLLPGRQLCGSVVVADIGIPQAALPVDPPLTWANAPLLWRHLMPAPGVDDHKYSRGHLVVFGGAEMTGAARLAALAARRAGAGLVTIACPASALGRYGGDQPGTLVECLASAGWRGQLADPRRTAAVVGPGLGTTAELRPCILEVLDSQRPVVLDADALTLFRDCPEALFAKLSSRCVLTPHEGEFARLFGRRPDDKLAATRDAARRAGVVVLLKGADTVIAAPDGRAAISGAGSPALATAGSGDVLAGILGGLLAAGMATFEASCSATWLQGTCAMLAGDRGLIAEDLISALPRALNQLSG